VDPLTPKYPELTPYQYASNNPVAFIDLDGLEGVKPDGHGTEAEMKQTKAIEGVGPGGHGEVTRYWYYHEGGVNGSKPGWYRPEENFSKVLKPIGKAYNDYWGGKGSMADLSFYLDFVSSREDGSKDYHELVANFAKDLRENPTYDSWKKWLPIWGAYKQAKLDFNVNKNGWGIFNTVMAISDVFLVKSLVTAPFKTSLNALGKEYAWWTSWRRFYVREGLAEAGQELHH